MLYVTAMKKKTSKLILQQETLRTLTVSQLDKAAGGYEDASCTAKTKLISGCASIIAEPNDA